MVYNLLLTSNALTDDIRSYLSEFRENGEYCQLLWPLEDGADVSECRRMFKSDENTDYLCFYIDDTLVGMGRCTKEPNHIENGKIGYSIRPSQRGKLYAPVLIRMLESYCEKNGISGVTACVDARNSRSIQALHHAGFEQTGVTYNWTKGRKALEFAPRLAARQAENS